MNRCSMGRCVKVLSLPDLSSSILAEKYFHRNMEDIRHNWYVNELKWLILNEWFLGAVSLLFVIIVFLVNWWFLLFFLLIAELVESECIWPGHFLWVKHIHLAGEVKCNKECYPCRQDMQFIRFNEKSKENWSYSETINILLFAELAHMFKEKRKKEKRNNKQNTM